MKIPFLDLQRQYDSIKASMDTALHDALLSFRFSRGPEVTKFENEFSKSLQVRNCISCGNGTDALFAILKKLDLKEGDEVITPAFSWISSSEAITLCGAKPVFVDVDPAYYTLDADVITEKVNVQTKAIVAVHLYGQAAGISQIESICKKYDLSLIEDCAQAHFTKYNGQYVGTFGRAAAFSFYPTKNLGAYGDAGCVVSNDDNLAERIRRFTNHGALEKDDHVFEGVNSRLDTIQAAILLAKLPFLKHWNTRRIAHASVYSSLLSPIKEVITPLVRPDTEHTFHLYAIRAKRRNELQLFLQKNGIQTLIHYPKALPNLEAYRHLNHKPKDFPVATMLQNETLSLPIYPELTEGEVIYICEKIKEFYGN